MKVLKTVVLLAMATFIGVTPSRAEENEVPELKNYLTMVIPSRPEATPANCRTPFGNNASMTDTGLGAVILGINVKGITTVSKSPDITMSYSVSPDSPAEVFSSINVSNNADFMMMGMMPFMDFDEDGLPVFTPTTMLMFLFSGNGKGDLDNKKLPLFKRDGTYTINIPDGVFSLNRVPMSGVNIVYNYSSGTTTVEEITSTPSSYDVYSLNGTLLRRCAPDLDGLTPGLYIINGKKMLVR